MNLTTEGAEKPLISMEVKRRFNFDRNEYVYFIDEDEPFQPLSNLPDSFRFDKYGEGLEARYKKITGKDLF